MSSLSWIDRPSAASVGSFSHGSSNPAPPVNKTNVKVGFLLKINFCRQNYLNFIMHSWNEPLPDKRIPEPMHSKILRIPDPGDLDMDWLLRHFSTNNSIACRRKKVYIRCQVIWKLEFWGRFIFNRIWIYYYMNMVKFFATLWNNFIVHTYLRIIMLLREKTDPVGEWSPEVGIVWWNRGRYEWE